jgi:hypothetical protein
MGANTLLREAIFLVLKPFAAPGCLTHGAQASAIFPRAETRNSHRCGPIAGERHNVKTRSILAAAAGSNTARQSLGLTHDMRGLQRSQQSMVPSRQTILLKVIMLWKVC